METLEAALQEVENIPAYLPNCLQLQDVIDKAKNWLQEAEALQVRHIPAPFGHYVVAFLVFFCQSRIFMLPARGSHSCAGQPF